MRHQARIQHEFARQAESFASSPTLNAPDLIARIREVLGVGKTARVLDLACGPGIVAAALAPEVGQVVALDLTSRMIELARSRCRAAQLGNVQYSRAPAEALPFGPGTFHAVVTRLSFHHFEDPAVVLAEIERVIQPAGTFVLLDLVTSSDPRESELHNALERLRDPSHVRMLSVPELRSLVSGSGFEILSESVWGSSRDFDEWAGIVAEPTRTSALRIVMQHLARAGVSAGIGLRERQGRLEFDYRWTLIAARARPEGPDRIQGR